LLDRVLGLLPLASVAALETVKGVAEKGADSASSNPLAANGTVDRIAGFPTIGELFRSWHKMHVNVGTYRKHTDELRHNVKEDRVFNQHLAMAVGDTIRDLLHELPNDAVPECDQTAVARLIDRASNAFRAAKAEGMAPTEFSEKNLVRIIEAANNDHDVPWGSSGMWCAVVNTIADHAGVGLDESTVHTCAAFCQKHFVRRFFSTIRSDLQMGGAAFASIHLRMMSELVVVARENAASLADVRHDEAKVDAKLDNLCALVSQQGRRILANSRNDPQFRVIETSARWLIGLDGRLARTDGHLSTVDGELHEVYGALNCVFASVRASTRWLRKLSRLSSVFISYKRPEPLVSFRYRLQLPNFDGQAGNNVARTSAPGYGTAKSNRLQKARPTLFTPCNYRQHVLHQYPRCPMVPSYKVSSRLTQMYADLIPVREARQLIDRANALRQDADPEDDTVTLIKQSRLRSPENNAPIDFWIDAFGEAGKYGPRMLAALLLVLDDAQFDEIATRDRRELLDFLRFPVATN
jgi:hypothetical protein